MNRITILIISLALASVFTACIKETASDEKSGLNIVPTKVAVIPDGVEAGEIVFSSDGRHVAYAAKKGGKVYFAFDGSMGEKPYLNLQNITFGPDNKKTAYRADTGADNMFMVIDGQEGKPYKDLGSPVFSPDGRTVAFEAMDGKQYVMAVGERETPPFDMPYAPPFFSPDSKQIVYIEQHYDKKTNNLIMCNSNLSGRNKGKDYGLVNNMVQSSNRSALAYTALKGGKKLIVATRFDGNTFVEKEGAAYDDVSWPALTADGKKLAYLAQRGKKLFVVVDGKETPFPAEEMGSALVLSPDGTRTAALGVSGAKASVVVDGKPGSSYDEVGKPVFSRDSKYVVYPARKGKSWCIVVNDKEGAALYDIIVSPQFSPDGSQIVCRARKDGKRFVVVADLEGRTIRELPRYEMVWQPVFTPDNKAIAYGAKQGRELWWQVEPLK